ncbi:hypothetical protein AAFN47_28010, partial [Hoeflea sp. CAU 1731]
SCYPVPWWLLLSVADSSQNQLKTVQRPPASFSNLRKILYVIAWKAAWRLLDLQEPPENGLGYGGSGTSGSSRPDYIRVAIMRTAREIIDLGASDPEMVSLMGFFEEEVGPDTISDFTTRVITPQLAEITNIFCTAEGIKVHEVPDGNGIHLPRYKTLEGATKYILLVPSDIVRDLPVANDWSDIEKAVYENRKIRDRVNAMLSRISKPTVSDRKEALKRAALESSDTFDQFLAAVKEHTVSYDPTLDALGYYKIKSILAGDTSAFKTSKTYDISIGPDALRDFVLATIDMFKHHVEKGNLWEELWIDEKPKKERAAQLIYYALADCFCMANNVDVSPEANMGGGPIDFKFSKGYNARVLVEIKRSSGTVVHGYQKQLEIYKDASRTHFGIFVVMDYGGLGSKLSKIKRIRDYRLQRGESASEIVVINARKKASASKRR